jgi:hypothetical protein
MNTAYHHGTGDPASQLSADLQSAESWEKRTDSVCFAWTKKLSQAGRGRLGLLTQPGKLSPTCDGFRSAIAAFLSPGSVKISGTFKDF